MDHSGRAVQQVGRGHRTQASRWRRVCGAAVAVAALVGVLPGQASAAPGTPAARPTIEVTPTRAIAKERVSVTATVPAPARRTVVLEKRTGSGWTTIATSRSSGGREAAFLIRPKSDMVVRVSAPATGGAAEFTSDTATINVVDEAAALTLESTALCANKKYEAVIDASPARAGRTVALQVSADRGKTWKAIGPTAREKANGTARITFAAPATVREYRFRAVLREFRGAPQFTGAAKKATVTTCVIVTENAPFVATGADHTCFIDADHVTWCMGRGDAGQTGSGDWSGSLYPTQVVGGRRFATIAVGSSHSCGLLADGTAYCWGDNGEFNLASGQGALGNATATDSPSPTPVAGRHKFRSIATGSGHTCGIATTGLTYCWGANKYGQIGDGSPTGTDDESRLSPTLVSGGWTFAQIFANRRKTCALTPAGVAYCWGISPYDYYNVPTKVKTDLRFTTLGVGAQSICGIATTGDTYCWDGEINGSFGDGSSGPAFSDTPRLVLGDHDFVSLTLGSEHSCGVTATRAAFCWGGNFIGMLGNGTTATAVHEPVAVSGSLAYKQLYTSYFHTCGVSGPSIVCWGGNGYGQLATGTSGGVDMRTVPTVISMGP